MVWCWELLASQALFTLTEKHVPQNKARTPHSLNLTHIFVLPLKTSFQKGHVQEKVKWDTTWVDWLENQFRPSLRNSATTFEQFSMTEMWHGPGWVLPLMVEPRVFSWITKEVVCIPPRNWTHPRFQWRPSPENVLPVEVSSHYFRKNYIIFSELRHYNDDSTGSQVTEAIVSAVIIFV